MSARPAFAHTVDGILGTARSTVRMSKARSAFARTVHDILQHTPMRIEAPAVVDWKVRGRTPNSLTDCVCQFCGIGFTRETWMVNRMIRLGSAGPYCCNSHGSLHRKELKRGAKP